MKARLSHHIKPEPVHDLEDAEPPMPSNDKAHHAHGAKPRKFKPLNSIHLKGKEHIRHIVQAKKLEESLPLKKGQGLEEEEKGKDEKKQENGQEAHRKDFGNFSKEGKRQERPAFVLLKRPVVPAKAQNISRSSEPKEKAKSQSKTTMKTKVLRQQNGPANRQKPPSCPSKLTEEDMRIFSMNWEDPVPKPQMSPEEILTTFPMIVFHKHEGVEAEAQEESCIICWTELKDNEPLLVLPCMHKYHPECLVKWLETKETCPVCKKRPEGII